MDADVQARLFRQAQRVTGLSLEDVSSQSLEVGAPDDRAHALRQATCLAGVLWEASVVLIDQLIDDVETLRSAADADQGDQLEGTWVLSGLPRRFSHRYSALFAQKLLAAAVDLTSGLTRGWEPPKCVAQELALRALLDQAECQAEMYEVDLGADWRGWLEGILFEDTDYEYLFDIAADGFEDDPSFGPPGMAPMGFDWWFVPYNQDRHLPPYSEDARPAGGGE